MQQRNNHFIPRCLLKRWVTNNGKYDGVNVLDIKKKVIDFSSSNGKKAYPFASIDDLYVLEKEGERLTNLEDWLSGLEDSLARFIDKTTQQKLDMFKHSGHLTKLKMSIISFEFRSPYFFEKGIQFLEDNPKIKESLNGKSNLQIILENVVNGTTEKASLLSPVDFIVWESQIPLLLCDRPLIFKPFDENSFFPMTPYHLLSFKKANSESTILYQKISDIWVNRFNESIINNARNWIVSITKDKLEYINSNYQFDQFDQKITLEEFKLLVRGYEY